MRRDREEVLRKSVVNLPRDARTLFGNRASELGEPNRRDVNRRAPARGLTAFDGGSWTMPFPVKLGLSVVVTLVIVARAVGAIQ